MPAVGHARRTPLVGVAEDLALARHRCPDKGQECLATLFGFLPPELAAERDRVDDASVVLVQQRLVGPAKDLLPYIVVQVVGAIVGAGILLVIASGKPGFDISASNLAANGYADHSPGGYSLTSALVTEIVLTFMFLIIILGATDPRAPRGFAPLAIGLGLTLIHLISIPVTNTSVNPARSTGPALFVGGWALSQLWLFWVAPLIGGAAGGLVYRWLSPEPTGQVTGQVTG